MKIDWKNWKSRAALVATGFLLLACYVFFFAECEVSMCCTLPPDHRINSSCSYLFIKQESHADGQEDFYIFGRRFTWHERQPVIALAGTDEDYFDRAVAAYLNHDYETAWKMLKPLADRGQLNSMFYIGEMYENGAGVKQDLVKAYLWYSLHSLRGGDKYADGDNTSGLLPRLAKKMSTTEVAEAKRMAAEWKPTPAPAVVPADK